MKLEILKELKNYKESSSFSTNPEDAFKHGFSKSMCIFEDEINRRIFELKQSWEKFCEPFKNQNENVQIKYVIEHHAKIGVLQELLTD